jgi:hypothetical protein
MCSESRCRPTENSPSCSTASCMTARSGKASAPSSFRAHHRHSLLSPPALVQGQTLSREEVGPDRRAVEYGHGRDLYWISNTHARTHSHPKYACEQAIWIVWFHGDRDGPARALERLGALNLVILFQASSAFSEQLTADKYPLYRWYQRTHCRFLPLGTLLLCKCRRKSGDGRGSTATHVQATSNYPFSYLLRRRILEPLHLFLSS